MLERLIRFGNQLLNNLDVFCFGIVITIVGRVIIKMILTRRHNKRYNIENSKIGVEDLLLPFISIFLIMAFVLLAKSWNGRDITDANVLSAIVSFISPFIAFTGAYALAEYNNERSDKIRSKEEEKEKEKKKLQDEKKLEHKKNMLYTMLEYSIVQTRIVAIEIEDYYKKNQESILYLIEKYNLTGKLCEDFKTMIKVESGRDCGIFMNHLKRIDNELSNIMNKNKISDRVIYIENWYDYLDCVLSTEEVQKITLWINLIKYSNMEIESYTYKFLVNRIVIDNIIKRNYPKAVNEGIRGKLQIDLGQ